MFHKRAPIARVRRKVTQTLASAVRPLFNASARQYMMDYPILLAFETAGGNQLKGDYYEFGVYKGRSFILAHRLAKTYIEPTLFKSMRFVAFDSFKGLPPSDDEYLPAQYNEGAFSASRSLFTKNCRRAGIPNDQIFVVPGFFSELFTSRPEIDILSESKVAIAYIDCDIYEGARDALKFLTPHLQVGTLLILDDWNRHHASEKHGIRRAVNEWLETNENVRLSQLALTKRVLFAVDFA